MAVAVSTRLSAAAGRSFGLTLGIAFGVLTAILWWRERETVATITAVLSVLLITVPRPGKGSGATNTAWSGTRERSCVVFR